MGNGRGGGEAGKGGWGRRRGGWVEDLPILKYFRLECLNLVYIYLIRLLNYGFTIHI